MGLAGPKNRSKISADPNNTTWSKSTDRFGHKILIKQGWTPGSYLGAKDASHASHYTAANASHIRVAVKDDNLGLGAKRGKAENETFGLSAFQGLLGRLNGKSDVELEKEESAQRDLKLALYQNQRFGSVRFVSGGFLVGDKIETLLDKNGTVVDAAQSEKQPTSGSDAPEDDKAAKKRKRREDDEAPKLKRKKRKSDLQKDLESSSQDDSEVPSKKKSKSKKMKKSKEDRLPADNDRSSTTAEKDDREKLGKKARKEAKKALKFERQAKKEARRLEKEQRRRKERQEESTSDSSLLDAEVPAPANESTPASQESRTSASFSGGRLAVRQRYIAQKKKASMDPQALREIFMIKAGA